MTADEIIARLDRLADVASAMASQAERGNFPVTLPETFQLTQGELLAASLGVLGGLMTAIDIAGSDEPTAPFVDVVSTMVVTLQTLREKKGRMGGGNG